MKAADAIAEIETACLTTECRAWLLALVQQQPEYRAELLQELHEAAGSYDMTLLLFQLAAAKSLPPYGQELAFTYAKRLARLNVKAPPTTDALKKRLQRTSRVLAKTG